MSISDEPSEQVKRWMSTVDKGWTVDNDWSGIEALITNQPRGAVTGAHAQVLNFLIWTQDPEKHTSWELALEALRKVDWIPELFIDSLEEVLRLGDPVMRDGKPVLDVKDVPKYVSGAKGVAAILRALEWPATK